jgi:phosphotransferase system  glucose/maltose/N-acetylglucosamine-specific IIC component
MQLKYNRRQNVGSSVLAFLFKILLTIVIFILAIFLIEKINFPSPEKEQKIDITNEIKKL